MEVMSGLLIGSQLVFTVIAGLYFYTNLKTQHSSKSNIAGDSKEESDKLNKLRAVHLAEPLSEKTRPTQFSEIVGQDMGIKALRAAICGPNPQHVLIYGPPGIGKTAAARLVLKEAAGTANSPFKEDAPFIEMDATILQFDERSIADPLMGSVHDPIYQGAGAYGQAGIPQPKPGAVTNAHGGVLFIDEIGELHSIQMNKLLKVLEDRLVKFSSSYYSKSDKNMPKHIHDIFENGLPADFRLIGATTRRPEEMPQALRSRCTEIYFNPLKPEQVRLIAAKACTKAGFAMEIGVDGLVSRYCANGRDAVNIIQTAGSLATLDGRNVITLMDVEEVIEQGRRSPVLSKRVPMGSRTGVANGLAVYNHQLGAVLEIEATVKPQNHTGVVKITGIIDEEEIKSSTGAMKRKSTVRGSVDNVLTLLEQYVHERPRDCSIHINFPGGMPVDGPSAGTAVFVALYSAFTGTAVPSEIAMTGEISIKGRICPVGGVLQKIEAARESGIKKVYIPKDNWQSSYSRIEGIEIVAVDAVEQLISGIFGEGVTIPEKLRKKREIPQDNKKGIPDGSVLTAKTAL